MDTVHWFLLLVLFSLRCESITKYEAIKHNKVILNQHVRNICCEYKLNICPTYKLKEYCADRKEKHPNLSQMIKERFAKVIDNLYDLATEPRVPLSRLRLVHQPTSTEVYLFCCECPSYNYKCPVCNSIMGGACHTFESDPVGFLIWYTTTFVPLWSTASTLSKPYSKLALPRLNRLGLPSATVIRDFFFLVPGNLQSCVNSHVSTSSYSFVEPKMPCFTAKTALLSKHCPSGSLFPENSCDYSKVVDNSDETTTICSAPYKRSIALYTNPDDPTQFCFRGHYIKFNFVGEYFLAGVNYDANYLPKYIGKNSDFVYFRTQDYGNIEDFLKRMLVSTWFFERNIADGQDLNIVYNLPVDEKYSVDDSWIGNIYVRKSFDCNSRVPFDNDHDICTQAYTTAAIYPFDEVVSKRSPLVTYDVEIEHLSVAANLTCRRLQNIFNCTLVPLIDYSFEKLYSLSNDSFTAYNKSFYALIDYLLDSSGRDNPSVQFYHPVNMADPTVKSLVGNWISGIFGVLIQPFFDVFVATVKLLLSTFVDLFDIWAGLFTEYFSDLLEILSKFVGSVIQLIISIIVKIETKFLLLEYTLLFLFVLYKVYDNTYFAVTIVILAVVAFGIVRKSPSFILFFVNEEYIYFNISSYYLSVFDYSYSLTYRQGDQKYTYSFKDGSVTN